MLKKLAFACLLTLLCGLAEAQAQDRCIVADPTGTPLNVRTAPNGRIVATLSNGTVVIVLARSSVRDKTWVLVRRYDSREALGWVFRDYLNCNIAQNEPAKPEEAGPSERAPTQPEPSRGSSGTGFFVASQYVLTNNHVIEHCGSNPIWVAYPDKRPERAYIAGSDEINDLALLRTDLPDAAIASFRFRPRLGETVAIYGFPLSGLLSSAGNFTVGNVTSLAGPNDDTRLLQTSAPTQPGNSGGPLLDMSGSVIGVVEGQLNALLGIPTPQNVNFAIQTPIVINFLSIKGISQTSADKGRKDLDPADVANLAKAFTIQVACYFPAPAAAPVQPGPTRPVSSLLVRSLGSWAIGDQSNCKVPSKAYSLRLDGGTIVWQDGLGNVDFETVLFSDENEFRTATVNSIHKSGRTHPVGTSWIYSRNGIDGMQIIENGQKQFFIKRCP